MRDNRHHTNPWADRLSQVSLPDGDAAWKGMELLLDKQMPVRKDRRRWILLILLLLLLIGVCNCPGRLGNRASHGGDDQVVRVSDGDKWGRDGEKRGGITGTVKNGNKPDGNTSTRSGSQQAGGGGKPGGNITASVSGHVIPEVRGGGMRVGGSRRRGHKTKNITSSNTSRPGADPTPAEENDAELPRQEGAATPSGVTTPSGAAPSAGQGKTAPPTKKNDSTLSQKKKPTPPAEEQKKQRANGWTVGIGLNQFFTIGGQQASHYNSGGISGTLGDYIPVPMVRYHFNRKFFIQLEAQFNSPQYTGKNLLISLPPLDSLSPTVRRQSSVLIKKLFYFNVPLSVHYRVFKNLDVGAGIQFSRLSNGIGLFQDRTINIGPGGLPDSISATSKSFKGDTLYKKIRTTELRALLDASYTQGRLIFGIRYNQALSQFIHVQVTPGQITQARNSSLQLYFRYVLWDNQKKQPYPTK